MANRQRAEARRKAQAKAARTTSEGSSGSSSQFKIWLALGLVLVLGVGIAIFVSRSDDSKATSDSSNTTDAVSSIPDTQPVTVSGEPLVPFDAKTSPDPAVGAAAPLLSGLNFAGQALAIDPAANGPYMLVFLAHWCPHCNAEVPRLNDWKHTGAVPPELNVVGVATAVSPTNVNYPPGSWFSNMGWEWPVIVDESQGDGVAGKAAQAFGASGWPYFVIIGADGKVKVRVSGEVEASELGTIVATALAA